MKPPRPTQRKFAFKLSKKPKKFFFDRFIYSLAIKQYYFDI